MTEIDELRRAEIERAVMRADPKYLPVELAEFRKTHFSQMGVRFSWSRRAIRAASLKRLLVLAQWAKLYFTAARDATREQVWGVS